MQRTLWISLTAALMLAACIPGRVKNLNAMGQKAYADRKYDQAIAHFRESLGIYPNQPAIRQQLRNAKANLKDIFVFQIYELVDGPNKPIESYLRSWEMSAQLTELGVPKPRVMGIRVDLDKRFVAAEPRLRKTEAHKYYGHLARMSQLAPSAPVDAAMAQVADGLVQTHLTARKAADTAQRAGLALLHTTAAATFAPRDTGLWQEATQRRTALLNKLAIVVAVHAESAVSAHHSRYLLGGVRRRLPRIFKVKKQAPLVLALRANRPTTRENRVSDRRSARCKVGTRRVPNPACPTLRNRSKMARRDYSSRLKAYELAQQQCRGAKPGVCTRYLSDAERDLRRAKKDFEGLARKAGRCPAFLHKPVYKMFFYERITVTRSASATGSVTVSQGGQPVRAHPLRGGASARDTFGSGLACARIPADPLTLPSPAALKQKAEEQLLNSSISDLLAMRRALAKKQMAGGRTQDERLDSLVRARLVDDSFKLARSQLKAQLAGIWWSDFKLSDRVVRQR